MLDPISYTIEVPCNQQRAFETFANIGSWWPLDKRSMATMQGKQNPVSLTLEPQVGGKIVETGEDGTEYHWGTVRTFDPNDLFIMDFHMGLPAIDPCSQVEVAFTALDDNRTKVVLTQGNWEAFGDMAEMMRNGYGSSWHMLFEEIYKAACED
jgi:hypothetical protein